MKPGLYIHFKGGKYQVYGLALHSETEQEHVVYRPLYGERRLWIRPRAEFEESVTRDGRTVPRFRFIEGIALDEQEDLG